MSRLLRRLGLAAIAAVLMISLGGCTPEICSQRTFLGFLVCDPDMVEEATRPNPNIELRRGEGPPGDPYDMYADQTFVAGSEVETDPFLPGDYIATEEWDIDGQPGFEQRFPYAGSSVERLVRIPELVVIRLRATDQEGNSGEASTTLRVVPRGARGEAPPPGIAIEATPRPSRVGEEVQFTARLTDLRDKVDWDLDGVPGYEITDQGPSPVYHTYWRPGGYTIHARIRDAAGGEAEDSLGILVRGSGGTEMPIASFSVRPNPGMPHEPIHMDATGSRDPDGGPLLRWEWDIFDQPGIDIDRPDQPRVTTSYLERPPEGGRPLFLRVTDDDGNTASMERFLQLDPPGTYEPPAADLVITPSTITVGQPVTFDASASTDADGNVVRYEWDLDGSSTCCSSHYEIDGGATPTYTHTYTEPSHHETGILVGVRVTDDDGREGRFQTRIHVRPAGPGVAPRRRALVSPAARSTTTRMFARFDRLKPVAAGRVRGSKLAGLRLRGRIAGRLLKPNGEEATASPRVLGQILRGTWSTRLDLGKRGDGHTVSGLALAKAPGRRGARACLRLSLRTGTPKDGRTPLTGSFRVLGGDRAAARLRASGKFGLEIRPNGTAVAAGQVTSSAGRARKLPAACRRLAR
jgi:hypothetical protein